MWSAHEIRRDHLVMSCKYMTPVSFSRLTCHSMCERHSTPVGSAAVKGSCMGLTKLRAVGGCLRMAMGKPMNCQYHGHQPPLVTFSHWHVDCLIAHARCRCNEKGVSR